MLLRAAAVLAAGFLVTGPAPAAPGAARTGGPTGGTNAITSGQCPAHWTVDDLPVPPLPASAYGGVQSVAALSATDAFALVATSPGPAVYHFTHGAWQKLVSLNGNVVDFTAMTIVAKSDTDVWVAMTSKTVTTTATYVPDAWHFDGSTWTDHPAPVSPQAEIQAAALGSDGVLYVTGSSLGPNGPDRGIVWAYNGSGWSDLTPASPRYQYDAVAVTADGTLVVGASNGLLQERSGTTWTTVRLSAPVTAVTGISASPDGTVYATGTVAGNQPVLIEQRPGSRSAAVLDAPTAPPAGSATTEKAVVAVGQGDVWLLGQGPFEGPVNGNYVPVPWITHFDGRRFVVAAATPGFSVTGGASLGPDILAYGTALNTGAGAVARTFIAVCPVQVTRDAFVPPYTRTPIGAQMFWSVPATGAGTRHELVAPGMFDSGPLSPGGSFEEDLFAAATYRVWDTATGATETVRVPAAVTPASGVTGTVFTVTCASLQAPAGYAYRLLIERPGSARYTLLTATSQPATTFLPYHGAGTYRFECQVQTPEGVTAASPPAAASVSLPRRPGMRLRRQAPPVPGPGRGPRAPRTAFLLPKDPLKRDFCDSLKGKSFPEDPLSDGSY